MQLFNSVISKSILVSFSPELKVDRSDTNATKFKFKLIKLNGFSPDIEFSLFIGDYVHII